MVLALVFQIIYYVFYTLLYQKSFSLYGIKWRFKSTAMLVLASLSVSLMAPLGSLAGAGIFVHKAKKEKLSEFAVVAGLFIAILADFLALFIFLTLSIVFLVLKHNIFRYELIGYAIFVALMAGIIAFLVLGVKSPKTFRTLLKIFQLVINKIGALIKQKVFLPVNWFENKTGEFKKISADI